MKESKSIVLVTAIVLLLLAVGSSIVTSPTVSPPTATPQPAPKLPLGTYTNEKTFHGSETLTILDGGRYTQLVPEVGLQIKGTWMLTPDQVTFAESEGGMCSGMQGTYIWALDGKALTFTKVQDGCLGRGNDFPSGSWITQP